MKILYMHAKDLRIETDTSSRHARKLARRLGNALPQVDEGNMCVSSQNALLALVCVEKGDEKLLLSKVRDDILKAKNLLGVPEIVIGPFAHLSENVAEPEFARKTVEEVGRLVQEVHLSTKQFPFGWDKTLELKLPSHHYNVALRTFYEEGHSWIRKMLVKLNEFVKLKVLHLPQE